MSLLGKNILNDLVKRNGNKSLINSSNIVNNSGKYSNVSFNSLKTKINKTTLEPEFAPANLMYFLQTAFNGNYGFLGFAFLYCYIIDKDKQKKVLNAQEIYHKYFKKPEEVKKIISYYTDFYNDYLDEVIDKITKLASKTQLQTFIQDLKTKYNKTYFQIIPFYLLQFINVQDFKFDTAIGEKIKELLINPDFKEKCIQLYQIYNQNQNQNNSQELTEGLLPYLKNNISFQVLISNMGFNKIGKGIGDDIWIYKTENSAGILTSNRINKDEPAIENFFKTNLGIDEKLYQNITEEEYGLLKSYYNFLQTQISDTESSKDVIIVFLLTKQVERLNEIKVNKSIVGVDLLSQVGGTLLNPNEYKPLLNTDRLEIVLQNTKANAKESVLKTILIKMIILAGKESGKTNTELKNIEKKIINQDLEDLNKNYLLEFDSFYEGIDRFIQSLSNPSKDVWVKCKKNCKTLAEKYIGFETKTTLYYLTFLAKSLIEDDQTKKLKLVFTGPNSGLTGFWKDDMKLFKLDSEQFNKEKGRLIMGFGPSASGKTYWAKNIIKILKEKDSNFPTDFLSIDGGIMREVSLTYKMLKDLANTKVKGFENLGGGKGPISWPLFNTDKIKGQVLEFLKQPEQPKPNLYVPLTLAECAVSIGPIGIQKPICKNQYQRYIDITKDDKWTKLMIYQHLTQKQCPYKELYKCKGCKESGEEREVEEGKKYSSSSWKTAYEYGLQQYKKKAGGYKILIHNSGRKGYYSLIYSPDLQLKEEILEDEKILEKYKLKKCENENCDTFIDKDLIIFEEKIIRLGEEQIPYTRKNDIYKFVLNDNQYKYKFKLKGDYVSFYKGESNILTFKNQNFIKVPIRPGTNMKRLNMNELLLLVIFSLIK